RCIECPALFSLDSPGPSAMTATSSRRFLWLTPRPGPGHHRGCDRFDLGKVIEHPLVNGPELLGPEIPIPDPLAPLALALDRSPSQRPQHVSDNDGTDASAFPQRRRLGRKQSPIERRHTELVCLTPSMSQPRDRAHRIPEPTIDMTRVTSRIDLPLQH